jgi:hypothetical protein
MDEKAIRQEAYHLAHHELHCYPITQTDAAICPRCHAKIKPPIGRPDIMVLNPWGPSYVIEMKAIRGGSFAFSQLEEQQRKWLTNWMEYGGLGYLGVGTLERPRRFWLIDWDAWLRIEDLMGEVQKSLPVVAGKGYNRILQDNGWDFDHLCEPYELIRITGGWELQDEHSLRRLYESRHIHTVPV